MNRELFSYTFVLIALFVGAIYLSDTIQSPIIASLNTLKSTYHTTNQYISDRVDKYFFQADEIASLKQQLEKYKNNHLVMQALADEIYDLKAEENSTLHTHPQVELVRAISYEKFGNFNRVWMDIPDYNGSKIYGLTYKGLVAGIIINKNRKPLALLNQDIKSAYAVFIGKQQAPGIAHGNNDADIVVSFIPAWFKINIGDEVVSSGLDNIFIKGLKVGKVLSVSSTQGYQTAVVAPYYKSYEPTYFHMIKSVR